MTRTREEREEWAEDHGYWHWKCRDCGMSGWTDTRPECACTEKETDQAAAAILALKEK